MSFGRYTGWTLGEIGRTDLEYLEWLDRMPIGRAFGPEIDALLRQHGRRSSTGDGPHHGRRMLLRPRHRHRERRVGLRERIGGVVADVAAGVQAAAAQLAQHPFVVGCDLLMIHPRREHDRRINPQ